MLLKSSLLFSQLDSSLIGKWKTTAAIVGNVYYNFENDSISILAKASKYPIDTSNKQKIRSIMSIYPTNHLEFKRDGSYLHIFEGHVAFEGTFFNNSSKKVIFYSTKISQTTDPHDQWTYIIKDGLLYISTNSEGSTELIFRKE